MVIAFRITAIKGLIGRLFSTVIMYKIINRLCSAIIENAFNHVYFIFLLATIGREKENKSEYQFCIHWCSRGWLSRWACKYLRLFWGFVSIQKELYIYILKKKHLLRESYPFLSYLTKTLMLDATESLKQLRSAPFSGLWGISLFVSFFPLTAACCYFDWRERRLE